MQLEQSQTDVPMKGALWCLDKLASTLKANPLIGNTLCICSSTVFSASLSTRDSPLFPILGNPAFTPGLGTNHFPTPSPRRSASSVAFSEHRWLAIYHSTDESDRTIQTSSLEGVTIAPLLALSYKPSEIQPWFNDLWGLLFGWRDTTAGFSQDLLFIGYPPPERLTLLLLQKWETDLHRSFSEHQKQLILRFSWKSSFCTKIQETNYKILTRWYHTPHLLKMFYPNTSDRCWRCQMDRGMLLHIIWSCPKLKHFWLEVRRVTQKFTGYEIPADPTFFLLHVSTIPAKSTKNHLCVTCWMLPKYASPRSGNIRSRQLLRVGCAGWRR